jgi:hypothetical protein
VHRFNAFKVSRLKNTTQAERRNSMKIPVLIMITPLIIGSMASTAFSAPTGPIMRLFPTTVLEDIRETGEVAEDMENNIQDIIARLDLQQQLFTESQCAGADEDPGCDRIAKQLGSTYLEMLNVMSQSGKTPKRGTWSKIYSNDITKHLAGSIDCSSHRFRLHRPERTFRGPSI